MTTTSTDVDADKRKLRRIGVSLRRNETRRDELMAERVELVERLAAAGVQHAELAELAGTTRYNVRYMLFEQRRRTPDNGSRAGVRSDHPSKEVTDGDETTSTSSSPADAV